MRRAGQSYGVALREYSEALNTLSFYAMEMAAVESCSGISARDARTRLVLRSIQEAHVSIEPGIVQPGRPR
jgi:hypothetical protein